MLAEWQGPAENEPAVLFDEKRAEHLAVDADTANLADWVAVTALSGFVGNAAYEAIKRRVLAVLTTWRHRFGQAKLDEVKQHLLVQMQHHRKNPKITDEDLRERIALLFDEIQVQRTVVSKRKPPANRRAARGCPRRMEKSCVRCIPFFPRWLRPKDSRSDRG